jgi:hypothetical protein
MTSDKRIFCTVTVAVFVFILLSTWAGFAQVPDKSSGSAPAASSASAQEPKPAEPADASQKTSEPPGGNHVFGVLPNFRTVNESQVTGPLTLGQKFSIASKDSFDYPLVLLAAGLAGIGQWSDENPSFRQGMAGFGKRLVTGYADQALGNMMTEGVFPSLLHEDPRYYRRGTGGTWSRTRYSVTRLFVTHTDSGRTRFNYSEWIGNSVAVAVSNAYYPDGRTAGSNAVKLMEQCSLDGFAQVLKEFWPDVKQKFFEHPKGSNSGHERRHF